MSCHQPFKAHQNLRFYFSWKSPSHLSSWACQTAQRVSSSQQVPDTGFHTQTAPSEKLTKTYRAHWPSHIWCMCLLSPHFKQDPAMNMLRNVCVCVLLLFCFCIVVCVLFSFRPDKTTGNSCQSPGQYVLLPTGNWHDLIWKAWHNRQLNSWGSDCCRWC